MKVRVLYFDDCPNYQPTVELIEQSIEQLGVQASVELVKIDRPHEVETNRFLGSPTVQVDGIDIDPAARDRSDYAMSCRRYGGSGVPTREMIIAALKGGNGHNGGVQ